VLKHYCDSNKLCLFVGLHYNNILTVLVFNEYKKVTCEFHEHRCVKNQYVVVHMHLCYRFCTTWF